MKKVLFVFLTLAVIFDFVGCSNTEGNSENTSTETYADSKNSLADEQNENQIDSTKEVIPVKKMINMNIIVGNETFTAILEDNDTAKALVKQLPLTVDMSELNGNEKYNYLQNNLCLDTSSCPNTINAGDLMLYGNNCIVLFYKTLNTSYSYVKLGHIDDTTGLAKAVGSGSVKVTFSARE